MFQDPISIHRSRHIKIANLIGHITICRVTLIEKKRLKKVWVVWKILYLYTSKAFMFCRFFIRSSGLDLKKKKEKSSETNNTQKKITELKSVSFWQMFLNTCCLIYVHISIHQSNGITFIYFYLEKNNFIYSAERNFTRMQIKFLCVTKKRKKIVFFFGK